MNLTALHHWESEITHKTMPRFPKNSPGCQDYAVINRVIPMLIADDSNESWGYPGQLMQIFHGNMAVGVGQVLRYRW